MNGELYLGVRRSSRGNSHTILLTADPSSVLAAAGGRASPVFHIHGPELDHLPQQAALLICFPAHPADYLAAITHHDGIGLDVTVYITHGLGSVVLVFPERSEAAAHCHDHREQLVAAEIWQVSDDEVLVTDVLDLASAFHGGGVPYM